MDENLAILLQSLAESGIEAEFFAMDDACPVCRSLAGKLFDATDATTIPVPTCENDICRCDYLPVVHFPPRSN